MKPTPAKAVTGGVGRAGAFGEHTGQSKEVDGSFLRGGWKGRARYQSPRTVCPAPAALGQVCQAPLCMPKADEARHVSIPAPVRSTSSRMLSASAPRICSGEGEPQPFSLLQARFTFVSSWAYCSQKPALPVMHQMCKKSSRSSCYHRQPHLQQQRLVL